MDNRAWRRLRPLAGVPPRGLIIVRWILVGFLLFLQGFLLDTILEYSRSLTLHLEIIYAGLENHIEQHK